MGRNYNWSLMVDTFEQEMHTIPDLGKYWMEKVSWYWPRGGVLEGEVFLVMTYAKNWREKTSWYWPGGEGTGRRSPPSIDLGEELEGEALLVLIWGEYWKEKPSWYLPGGVLEGEALLVLTWGKNWKEKLSWYLPRGRTGRKSLSGTDLREELEGEALQVLTGGRTGERSPPGTDLGEERKGEALLVLTSGGSNVHDMCPKRFVPEGRGDSRWTAIQIGPALRSRSSQTHPLRPGEVDAFPWDASDLCHVSGANCSNTWESISCFIFKIHGHLRSNHSDFRKIQNIIATECFE